MLSKHLIGKLYEYFKTRLGMYDYTKGWLKGNCPACGREDKFGVHLGMYRSNCFVCGYHERPLYVVSFIEGLDYNGTLVFLKALEGVEYIEPKFKELEDHKMVLPDGFRLLNQGTGVVASAMRNYVINKRGLDPQVLSIKGWGYCVGDRLFGYLIIPYYVGGKLVYYTTRRVLGDGPKFDNPDIEDVGIGKSLLIYNGDALGLYDKVYLVESAMNAETLGDSATAIGGKKISKHQLGPFVSSGCTKVIIILDPDAYSEALELGMKLAIYKSVKVVLLPEGEDVNSYGRRNTLIRVWKSRFMDYNPLLKCKKDYERSQYTY